MAKGGETIRLIYDSHVIKTNDAIRKPPLARRFVPPSEVGLGFLTEAPVDPHVSSPILVVTMVLALWRGKGTHPLAHLQVVTDQVVGRFEAAQLRNSKHIPVECSALDRRRVVAPVKPGKVDRHVPAIKVMDHPRRTNLPGSDGSGERGSNATGRWDARMSRSMAASTSALASATFMQVGSLPRRRHGCSSAAPLEDLVDVGIRTIQDLQE